VPIDIPGRVYYSESTPRIPDGALPYGQNSRKGQMTSMAGLAHGKATIHEHGLVIPAKAGIQVLGPAPRLSRRASFAWTTPV
jgi:hypothetical protein